jgi:hypothetical protein
VPKPADAACIRNTLCGSRKRAIATGSARDWQGPAEDDLTGSLIAGSRRVGGNLLRLHLDSGFARVASTPE